MPVLQLTVLAVVAMVGLVTLRVVRIRLGRTPLPEGRGRRLFLLAFVVVPPLAFAYLTLPGAGGPLRGIGALPVYVLVIATLAVIMSATAMIVGQLTHGRSGRLVRLALVGHAGDPHNMPTDPPMTANLAESMAIVVTANGAFPRGPQFAGQVDRAGFRDDWEALDGATRTLEGRIADDRGLGLGVAETANATAWDARTRLETLRQLAIDHGQAWAAA
jgi:hypothetical protein